MAKNLTISMTEQQASATAQAITNAYASIDKKMSEVDNTMLSVAPLMATLKTTNGWKFLDNLDSEGNTDHKTFTKFAEDYFNKSHSVISETCKVGVRFFQNGSLIDDKYSEYGYTQLLRLSPLTDKEISENDFTPEMSSTDIRKKVSEIVKGNKAITEKKKQSEKQTTDNEALNEALQALGVEPLPVEPENTDDTEEYKTAVYQSDELPAEVLKWFDTLMVNSVTIIRKGE